MILILWPTSDTLWKGLELSATLKFQVWDSQNKSKNLPSWCINYKLVRNRKFWPNTILRLSAHMPCLLKHFCQHRLLVNKRKVERWDLFCKRMWLGQNLEPATLPQMCCPADHETGDHVKLPTLHCFQDFRCELLLRTIAWDSSQPTSCLIYKVSRAYVNG